MPTIAGIQARIRREGQPCTLRRPGISPAPSIDVAVQAFVREYKPQELVAGSGVQQGDRAVIISNAEIAAAGWPGTPKRNDQITISGKTATVQACETRMFRGEIAMHLMQVRGG